MSARLPLTLLACASVLALSACKDDNPPAPAAYDFASAPPALIEANAPAGYDGYALAERAHAFDRVTYQEAPSYGFRYGDEERWAWRTADDYSMYAEPYDDGYRNYYYAPGADYPYFIRDDDYGYGYGPDGRLIVVYDSYGRTVAAKTASTRWRRWPAPTCSAPAPSAATPSTIAIGCRSARSTGRPMRRTTTRPSRSGTPRPSASRSGASGGPATRPRSVQFIPRGQVLRWSKADRPGVEGLRKGRPQGLAERGQGLAQVRPTGRPAAPPQASRAMFDPRQGRAEDRGQQRPRRRSSTAVAS